MRSRPERRAPIRARALSAIVVAALLGAAACGPVEPTRSALAPAAKAPARPIELEAVAPGAEGLDAGSLLQLAEWVLESDEPIYSVLVSRHGRLVFELYTGGRSRDEAHYLMSVTKSVLSALVGIAVDQRALPAPETPLADILPPALFGAEQNRARFRGVTLRDVMGMSALDARTPPHLRTPEAVALGKAFWSSPNRAAFALTQPLLDHPGETFQYNDVTPTIAAAAIASAEHAAPFDFAEHALFGPMGFANAEWMHQDGSGLDNGGYGLRLRPVDMQKFGILYLERGVFAGRRLLSEAWVDRSFTPYERSPHARGADPDYGWFWWRRVYAGWTAHVAVGWKGQRIAVFPEQGLVVTMTGCFEHDGDEAFFADFLKRFVKPALDKGATSDPTLEQALVVALASLPKDPPRVLPTTEPRMVPSREPKERRRPFTR